MRFVASVCFLLVLGAALGLGWLTFGSANSDTQQADVSGKRAAAADKLIKVVEETAKKPAQKKSTATRPPVDENGHAAASLNVPTQDAQAKETTDVADQPDKPVATAQASPVGTEKSQPQDPFPRKVALPPTALSGGLEWLNASGEITLGALRGKVVLLDFWAYCCINCMHVLPDLKKLEAKYPNQLVVIGVHSAKFDAERDSENIRNKIIEYDISHPVVNDGHMKIWRAFDVHSWPTLLVIDPESNAVGMLSGEGVYDTLDRVIAALVKYHRAKGTLNETPLHFSLERSRQSDTPLRHPGKVLADPATDRLFIADTQHNRIVVASLAGKVSEVIGTGEPARTDGPFEQAAFFRPQGMAVDGDVLYVADTENHAIRRLDFKAKTVTTVAGTGEQGQSRSHLPMPAKETALSSPWDLLLRDRNLYIAMAGTHQIWVWEQEADVVRAYAGSGREDIEDGEFRFAAFAQPSGLAMDGKSLFVADSEGSSIRAVPFDPRGEVQTIVGTSHLPEGRLFTFGDADGRNGEALLQHCLGVAWADGTIYVADTYNNKIKAVDPEKQTSVTFLGDGSLGKTEDPPRFSQPGGLHAVGGKLYIADTHNHAIRVADLKTAKVTTLELQGLAPPRPKLAESPPVFPNARKIALEAQSLAPAAQLELRVKLTLTDGYKLNDEAPISYLVELLDAKGLVTSNTLDKSQRVAPPAAEFTIPLATSDGQGSGSLRVSLTYLQCRDGASGLCEIKSVIWEVPVQVTPDAKQKHIELVADAEPAAASAGGKLSTPDRDKD